MRIELVPPFSLDEIPVYEPMQEGVHEPSPSPEGLPRKSKSYKLKTRTPLVTPGDTFKDSILNPDKAGRSRSRRERTKEYQSRLLYQLLIKEGLDYMNRQVHKLHNPVPTWEQLNEHLDDWAISGEYFEWTDDITIAHPYEIATGNVDGKGTLSFEKIERSVNDATDFTLDVWDTNYIPKKREQGRKGGMAFRKWSYKEYMETQGMSKAETAKHLGISTSTVANMRKHFKQEFGDINLNTGEIGQENEV
jgi:transposase